jgi:hypothetical protein
MTNPSIHIYILAVFFFSGKLTAQTKLEPFNCPVTWYDRQLEHAFTGGLNGPQFNEADLNNDGVPDLVVFDRAGDIILPYLRLPDGNGWKLELAPDYASYFPIYRDWGVMRDYNVDGVVDLFTYNNRGIHGFKAYTGRYQNDTLTFDPFLVTGNPENYFLFTLPNGTKTNIYVAFDDIPSIDDIDGDGDLDLLTFDSGGGFVNFFKNQSVEKGFGLDSLDFFLAENCWGKFYESGTSEIIKLSTSSNSCAQTLVGDGPSAQIRHAGSTLLSMDMNDDGLKELLIGDISFSNINRLTNGGTPNNAWMVAQDTFWPKEDIVVQMPLFPAAYTVDFDFDGVKDIIVAPNMEFGALDTANVWLYKNIGTNAYPDFNLTSKSVLVGDMLDVGSGARPAFMDVNGDGLLDMIIGNVGYFTLGVNLKSSLTLFLNVGTAQAPSFSLETIDYLGLSSLSQSFFFSFAPTFGDLDSDGDVDLLVGHANGTLFYFENMAGAENAPQFAPYIPNYQGLSSGSYSVPQIVDVNGDGLMDILIGAKVGNIKYFQNVGSIGNPVFNGPVSTPPNVDFYGQIDMRVQSFLSGHASPWMYPVENGLEMVVGSNAGQVRRYAVDPSNPSAKFPVLDSLYTGYRDGFETNPVMVDLDNDGLLEIVIGNLRGGLTAYKTGKAVVSSVKNQTENRLSFSARYNSNTKQFIFTLDDPLASECQIEISDMMGRIIGIHDMLKGIEEWPANHIPSGVFIIRAWSNGRQQVTKVPVVGH